MVIAIIENKSLLCDILFAVLNAGLFMSSENLLLSKEPFIS